MWCWNYATVASAYLLNQFPTEGVADLSGFGYNGGLSLIDPSGIFYRRGSAPTKVTCP